MKQIAFVDKTTKVRFYKNPNFSQFLETVKQIKEQKVKKRQDERAVNYVTNVYMKKKISIFTSYILKTKQLIKDGKL